MVQFFAAISHRMSAEDPESALDVTVRWISPHRQKLVDACVADLSVTWSVVRVEEVDGATHVQAGDEENF